LNRNKLVSRVGSLSIALAIVLRFAAAVAWGSDIPLFAQPEVARYLLYSQTGRKPAPTTLQTTIPTTTFPTTVPTTAPTTMPTTATTAPTTLQTTVPTTAPTTKPAPAVLTFSPNDAELLSMTYSCSYRPALADLLTMPLDWSLSDSKPTVLILHSHGTESYTPTADTRYEEYGGDYRTDDDRYNLISIGDELTRLLQQAGIGVIHDRTPYDKDDYLDAYSNARAAIQAHLQKNPTIRLVLDLHRDAAAYADGTQWATSATVNGQKSAQLMFVIGTDAGGNTHPNWKTNLSTAEKLHVLMEKQCAGITRPIHLRAQRFNQDLCPAAMIVEVGSAGNTHNDAMTAIPVLADAIIALQHGSQ